MSGARPEQAVLSRDTDMSKTEATRAVIEGIGATQTKTYRIYEKALS